MTNRDLTTKQKAVIDCMMLGDSMNDAVMKSYDCEKKSTAYVISHKLRKNEVFKEELEKREEIKTSIIKNEGQKLTDILEEIFPRIERAKILVEIARSGDVRSKLQALQEINKIEGIYPKEANTITLQLENARSSILSEGEYFDMQKEQTQKLLPAETTEETPDTLEETDSTDPQLEAIDLD